MSKEAIVLRWNQTCILHKFHHLKPGGERGIRTLDTGVSPYNGLANRRLQPLGHLSGLNRSVLAQVLASLRSKQSHHNS